MGNEIINAIGLMVSMFGFVVLGQILIAIDNRRNYKRKKAIREYNQKMYGNRKG